MEIVEIPSASTNSSSVPNLKLPVRSLGVNCAGGLRYAQSTLASA